MDDLELVRLASKASGFEYTNDLNPLVDDALALRLAVKLNLDLYQGEDEGPAAYAGYYMRGEQRQRFMTVQHGDDPYAATCRAIVMAAAHMGEAK